MYLFRTHVILSVAKNLSFVIMANAVEKILRYTQDDKPVVW